MIADTLLAVGLFMGTVVTIGTFFDPKIKIDPNLLAFPAFWLLAAAITRYLEW